MNKQALKRKQWIKVINIEEREKCSIINFNQNKDGRLRIGRRLVCPIQRNKKKYL